jgi:hypothetical protein
VWKKVAGLVVLAAAALSLSSSAEEAAGKKRGFFSPDNWQIDVYGGWTSVDPRCLNMFPQYYEKTIPAFNLDPRQYDKQVFGANYAYSVALDANNAFREIRQTYPLGLAVRYHLGSRLDLSLGLGYMSRKAESFYQATIATDAVPPNGYGTWGADDIDVLDLTYDDIGVSVRCWLPTLGAHYLVFSRGRLDAELSATAGPVFASFKRTFHEFQKYSFPNGTWNGFEYQGRDEGKGLGISLSGGARLGLMLLSRVEVFADAGYQLVSVPTLTGTRQWNQRYLDSESSPPRFTTTEWTGTWRYQAVTYSRSWGTLVVDSTVLTPLTANALQYTKPFDISLSGVRLLVGLSFRL